jgi:hypothetical protein
MEVAGEENNHDIGGTAAGLRRLAARSRGCDKVAFPLNSAAAKTTDIPTLRLRPHHQITKKPTITLSILSRRWIECKFHSLYVRFPNLFITACKILDVAHSPLSHNFFQCGTVF